MPHHHSQLRVAKAGKEAWVAETMPLLNRDRYVTETGARMSDAEVAEFLGEAWTTIATGGANQIAPGQFRGTGARVNRGSDSRVIHLRDGAASLDYQQQFDETAIYDAMTEQVQGVAKDITALQASAQTNDTTSPHPQNPA